jgi:hypothetical protein
MRLWRAFTGPSAVRVSSGNSVDDIEEQNIMESANMPEKSNQGARKATGPRTAAGKRRSRMNATKFGFFSKHLLLDGEDPAEFEKLYRDLRDDWQPVGRSQELEVEWLATQYWRRRRIPTAEGAVISRSPAFVGTLGGADLPYQQYLRACSKDGSTPVSTKVALFRCAMKDLLELAKKVGKPGFDFLEVVVKLQSIYGNMQDHTALIGFQKIVTLIDEIARLDRLLCDEQSRDIMQSSLASLLPAESDLHRIILYENHLSREIDRSINRLLRLKLEQRSSTTHLELNS